ncbi:unnamed protein product [Acanthoscelides obtectus]|uniref:Uncharacterized protein n=1 Tax=Acanthoscelides obtectus TaxID=200917 RepID=A0A9P0P4E3_ACAOB|nr:unnamed protein product [Acanthoscelides obtectus]CAK1631188.1 hypothetical protein AOBTE_LOCUS6803 [Acanthoscelides obtectus]
MAAFMNIRKVKQFRDRTNDFGIERTTVCKTVDYVAHVGWQNTGFHRNWRT